jgi:hypothetical protein
LRWIKTCGSLRGMPPLARIVPVLIAVAALACKEKPQGLAPQSASPAAPVPQRPPAFTLRDLAIATAVDARAARLSFAGAEVEAALAGGGGKGAAGAKELAARLDVPRAELAQAIRAVANPADRPLADALGARAERYAQELAGAVAAGAPSAGAAAARGALGDAVAAYRQARAAWRLDAPEPQGAEREFAEARRDMERAETAFVSRTEVAPREEGHLDPAALRMTGQLAVDRAKAAARQLPPAMRDAAARYAAAQEQVLAAVTALAQAAERDRAGAARAYHGAKAEALSALADYFAALAAR